MPKKIFIGSAALFAIIGGLALFKKKEDQHQEPQEVAAAQVVIQEEVEERSQKYLQPVQDEVADQEVDEVWRLFTTGRHKHPIVETIRYRSRVEWLKNRPAWVTDYASHYATSRHFIARSLNGKKDYYTQKISAGDHFNVLKKEVNFHLIVDLSRCKMWFFAQDLEDNQRHLLKTYKIGLGRFDDDSYSGLLTPKGTFSLGDKVAIYKPGDSDFFQGEEVEMVRVFGTRWIPFSEEISGDGVSPRGYGFHGAPWTYDLETESYKEDLSAVGGYESDGCIRLLQSDIEELYSIVITKPTVVEIVADFHEADIPGEE